MSCMYPAGNLFIPVAHGQLEAILKEPRQSPARAVALVLHPHPLGGGTMHNKVVFRAAAALNDAGVTTLRINFRGVGQSTGQHDEGRGELDDVRAGLDYLASNYPNLSIIVCGFSFGSRVGLDVGITDDRVKYLIGIGTPLEKYDFSFLEACRKPLLLVHGEHDEFGDVEKLREVAADLEKHTQVRLVVIPGAAHFFENRLDELKRAITDWINEQLL
ncbi:MAG TPA: alpha/beta fold hydrolase [Pyrinomonadaceae bacterium]|nr:alpha/beta fold hydrolase [Pyrinomonadaceae bacterium]